MEWGIILKCIGVLLFVLWAYPMGLYDFALPVKLKSRRGKAKLTSDSMVTADGQVVAIDLMAQASVCDYEADRAEAEGRNEDSYALRAEAVGLRVEVANRKRQASRRLKWNWGFIVAGIGVYVLIIWGLAEIL